MTLDPEEAIDRINAAFGRARDHRVLHAKGRFYAGTFTASPEAAALSRAAHLQGDPVPVVVRWSNGGGNPKVPDRAPDVRGMAVSFRPASGATTDLLGQTSPRFPVRTPEDFVAMTEAVTGRVRLPLFLLRHPAAVSALVANVRSRGLVMPHSFAEATYYPIHAYGWVDGAGARTWVRYRLVPLATRADRLDSAFGGKHRLREEIAARLAAGPVRFDLRATLAGPGDDPHDPMSVWKGSRDLIAGTIEVTEEMADPEADGDVVVFDPARAVDGIELSDDPILRYRPLAYSVSVERRSGARDA